MNTDLEKYILEISTKEDDLLHELYRKTHTSALNPHMISGHIQGKILEMLVAMYNPTTILEIGTYTGYSAICMARALPENGKLHTIEVNDEVESISSEFIERAGLKNKIIMHTGDAREIIPKMDMEFDMVFIDGDKREYTEYYKLVFDKIIKGGYILADNVFWDGKVYNPSENDPMTKGIRKFNETIKNDQRVDKVILPVRDGLMLIRKL